MRGIKIPFIDSLKPAEFINNKSAIHNSEFVTDSLRELIASKHVVEVPSKPTVVNLLSVSSNESKKPFSGRVRTESLVLKSPQQR